MPCGSSSCTMGLDERPTSVETSKQLSTESGKINKPPTHNLHLALSGHGLLHEVMSDRDVLGQLLTLRVRQTPNTVYHCALHFRHCLAAHCLPRMPRESPRQILLSQSEDLRSHLLRIFQQCFSGISLQEVIVV